MDKTFFEKQIEKLAEQRLNGEYVALKNFLFNNPIGKGLKIGNEYLVYNNGCSDVILEEYITNIKNKNLKSLLEKRREELVSIVTREVMDKLSSVEYLFRNLET